tara:strand:+ start:113 stop:727 length:615 start_codon:yes stop_codon:yes gene_type:complete
MHLKFFFLSLLVAGTQCAFVLFNFTEYADTSGFYEVSDTVRSVGNSKASYDMIIAQNVRRSVLFTLLNPQPDGACFAGVETHFEYPENWLTYSRLLIMGRSQGAYSIFKVLLKDVSSPNTFEQMFDTSNTSSRKLEKSEAEQLDFWEISLDLSDFYCDYRGKMCDDVIDYAHVTTFGLQAAGGVYENFSQSGPATLEIEWIALE